MVDMSNGKLPLLYCEKLIPLYAVTTEGPDAILTTKIEVIQVHARPGRFYPEVDRSHQVNRASDYP